jgi:hypothetical protein
MLAIWGLAGRLCRVQDVIETAAPASPRHRAALRRLMLYCRLILCATGSWQYDECARPARALLNCRHSNGSPEELAMRVRLEVAYLVSALTTWRPDRA